MFAVGLTLVEPLLCTSPTPLFIETEIFAFVVDQLRVVVWPSGMVVGLAESVAVGGGTPTVRVADFFTPLSVAEMVTGVEALTALVVILNVALVAW